MKELKFNSELQNLIPPLSDEEKKSLEDSLLKYGYKGSPIYTWNGYIIDGHNRYELCLKHNIEYPFEELDLGDKATIVDIMEWMINTQLGRRNLPAQQRIAIWDKFRKAVEKENAERKSRKISLSNKNRNSNNVRQDKNESDKSLYTRQQIAKKANVGTGTIARYDKVMKSNDEKIKKQMEKGELTINAAYEKIRAKEKKKDNVENFKTYKETSELYGEIQQRCFPKRKNKEEIQNSFTNDQIVQTLITANTPVNAHDVIVPKEEFDIMSDTLSKIVKSCDYRIFDLHNVHRKMDKKDIEYAIKKFNSVIEKIIELEEKIKKLILKENKTTNKKRLKKLEPDSIELLPCKLLRARLGCQRKPFENDVRNLAAKWIDSRCDPIDVSFREGQYGIIEGQKRNLAKIMIDPESFIVCRIYRGLTEEDEYRLFSEINNGKRTYGTNKDYAARAEWDSKWKYILECINKMGFSIIYTCGAKENTFGCASTLEEIYDEIGDIDFIDMLHLLRNICDGNKYSLQSTFIKGFAKFHSVYKSSVVEKELRKVFIDKTNKKITKVAFDKIKEKSKTYTQTKNIGIAVAFGILMRYNECCQPKYKLPFGMFDSLIN